MSFIYEKPRSSISDTFAGGIGSIADIYAAAREQMLYVDNTFASEAALDRAIDERNAEVFTATGFKPVNPLRAVTSSELAAEEADVLGNVAVENRRRRFDEWQRSIEDASARLPDRSVADKLTRNIDGDAIRIAREADKRLGDLMASRPGIGKWVATFAGGVSGSMRDPLAVGSLLLGAGPGAGRTVAARLISTAMKEAFVNGATEAVMQPMVQAWREKAGLDHGLSEAMANIGFAAAFGGVLGGAGQLAADGMARLAGRGLDAGAEIAALDQRVAEPVRRGLAGDSAAARIELDPIREALPAAQRGALDHAETLDHLEVNRPAAANGNVHDAATVEAHSAIARGETPEFRLDERQVARITADLAEGLDAAAPMARPKTLVEFLIDNGGVADFNGELAAIGVDKVTRSRRGRLLRKDGAALDMAREAAEEAGYIGRAGEVQTTSVADLLDAIDTELRGQPVYARQDMAEIGRLDDIEGERRRIADVVAEVAGYAGPAVDDAIVRAAADLSLREGIDPGDAFEQVLMRMDFAPVRQSARSGPALPGWSDAELEAASAPRGAEPQGEPGGPASDPGRIDPELVGDVVPAEILSWPAEQFGGDWKAGVDFLKARRSGELTGFLHNDEVGSIDVIWGAFDPATGNGAGLAKLVAKHPEVVGQLPEIVAGMRVETKSANRIRLHSDSHKAVVRLDYDGEQKTWLMTAYELRRRTEETTDRLDSRQLDGHSSSTSPATENIAEEAATDKAVERLFAEREADAAAQMIPTDEGLVPLADYLDAIKAEDELATIVKACRT